MPNEDPNVTGMTQTKPVQIGDENDFVLDFGDGETVEVKDLGKESDENFGVDTKNGDGKNISLGDEIDSQHNQDNLLDENVELQEEKIEENRVDLDSDFDDGKGNESEFDFSLDDEENNVDKSIDFEENDVNVLDNIDEKNDNMEENVENLGGGNENLGTEVNLEDEPMDFTGKSIDNNSQNVTDINNMQIEDLDKLFNETQRERNFDGKNIENLSDDVQSQNLETEEKDFGNLFEDNSEDVKDDKNLQEKDLNNSSNTAQEEDLFSDKISENLDDVGSQESKKINETDFYGDFNVEVSDDSDVSNQGKLENEGNKKSNLDADNVESENDDFFGDGDLFQGEVGEVDSEKSDGSLQAKKIEDDNVFDESVSASDIENPDFLELKVDKESADVLDDTQSSGDLLHEEDSLQDEKNLEDLDYDVNSKNLEDEYVKQPDMMDLLGGSEVVFSETDTVNQNQGSEMENSSEVIGKSVGLSQLDTGTLHVRSEDKEVNRNDSLDKYVENPGFVVDLSSDNKSDLKTESDVESGNSDISNNLSETQSQVDLGNDSENVVNYEVSSQEMRDSNDLLKGNSDILNSAGIASQNLSQNQMEDLNKVDEVSKTENIEVNKDVNISQQEGQEVKSTLSLDQIMDSAVNNNSQFVDNVNKYSTGSSPSNSGLFGKKKMVLVGIGIFLLAGIVAVLAFPSNVFERKPGDVFVGTGDNPGMTAENVEIGYENPESLGHDSPENPENQDDGLVKSGSVAGSSIMFPEDEEDSQLEGLQEIEGDIETIGDDIDENPEPYLGEDLIEDESISEEKIVLEKDYVISAINDYKSQAEIYRSHGYAIQDKKLIKYAIQAIYLCEVYQQQVENGEGVEEENFKNFESEINSLLSNLIQYEGGEEVQTFIQPNFNEEYYFEGKDEIRNYIYNR